MTSAEERAYEQGRRSVYQRQLADALRELGSSNHAALALERAAITAALRDLCGVYGDNDWTEADHLGDVIEKHLGRHLDEAAQKAGRPSR